MRGTPRLDLKPATALLIERWQPNRTDGYDIAIAQHDRATKLSQTRGHLMGLGAKSRHVAQTNHSIRPCIRHVGEYCLQRGEVTVDVRDDCDSHHLHLRFMRAEPTLNAVPNVWMHRTVPLDVSLKYTPGSVGYLMYEMGAV